MTANDIVKDLESVIGWFTNHGSNTNTAVIDISQRAIDVIERQRDRIKQLWEDCDYFEDKVKTIKSEAIREFAEELKKRASRTFVAYSDGYEYITAYQLSPEVIDIIVQEKTENFKEEEK